VRYSHRLNLAKGAVLTDEDILALLGLVHAKVGAGASLTWTITGSLLSVEGATLDELATTFREATHPPTGLYAKVSHPSNDTTEYERTAVTLDLATKEPQFLIVSRDAEWVASAARELRSAIAERRIRSSLGWRNWFVIPAMTVGLLVIMATATLSERTPDGSSMRLTPVTAVAFVLGIVLILGTLMLRPGHGEARIRLSRLPRPDWYDQGFVKGAATTLGLIGGLWVLYEIALLALNRR
jgi:hypothetical protein